MNPCVSGTGNSAVVHLHQLVRVPIATDFILHNRPIKFAKVIIFKKNHRNLFIVFWITIWAHLCLTNMARYLLQNYSLQWAIAILKPTRFLQNRLGFLHNQVGFFTEPIWFLFRTDLIA